jgi:hypothetical protein
MKNRVGNIFSASDYEDFLICSELRVRSGNLSIPQFSEPDLKERIFFTTAHFALPITDHASEHLTCETICPDQSHEDEIWDPTYF